jgi:hypothetical protein
MAQRTVRELRDLLDTPGKRAAALAALGLYVGRNPPPVEQRITYEQWLAGEPGYWLFQNLSGSVVVLAGGARLQLQGGIPAVEVVRWIQSVVMPAGAPFVLRGGEPTVEVVAQGVYPLGGASFALRGGQPTVDVLTWAHVIEMVAGAQIEVRGGVPTVELIGTGVVTSGLVGHWRAALATGAGPGVNPTTTVWQDLTANNLDLTLHSMAYTATSGWAGAGTEGDPYRLQFLDASTSGTFPGQDGTSSYSDAAYCLDAPLLKPAKITVEIKLLFNAALSANAAAFPILLSKYEFGDNSGLAIFFEKAASKIFWRVYVNGAYRTVEASVAGWSVGSMHHLFGMCDGRYVRLYDGTTELGTAVDLGAGANYDITHGARPLVLAGVTSGTSPGTAIGGGWEGGIILARLYDRALSQSEREQNIAAGN